MTFKNSGDKVVCIIQARMASSRLPGKVMKEVGGLPILHWMVERAKKSLYVDEVWVATTTDASDDPIEEYCREKGFLCFRGSVFDVLDRYYQAAKKAKADVIVRLTADCPLIDAELIDNVVLGLYEQKADFCANRLPPPFHRTYPIGLDVEAVFFTGLERAWNRAETKFEREHVMPYFYDVPDRFTVAVLDADVDYGHYRWTIDNPEDLVLVNKIVEAFNGRRNFDWTEVLALYEAHPEWHKINAEIAHKSFLDVDERLENSED